MFLKTLINITFYVKDEVSSFIFDTSNNINQLGQILYNFYDLNFLLAGLVLLVIMIGPVVLTLNFNIKQRIKILYKQLSRSDNSTVFNL